MRQRGMDAQGRGAPRRALIAAAAAFLLATCAREPGPPIPAGYPASYATTIHDALVGKRLVIWSAIDPVKVQPLLKAFADRYPALAITYREMPGTELNAQFLAATRSGVTVPDIIWSSAMDLQIKLVNDGYAQTYDSPEANSIADWAKWKSQAWGTTAEPIVFVYNRRLIDDAAMPRGHGALTHFLESGPLGRSRRIATYDLPSSAVGYLYFSQDQQATHGFWRLVGAMAAKGLRTFPNAEEVLADVASGRSAIGYDVVGSYAAGAVAANPAIGMVMPRDYTLVLTRIAIIPAAAHHRDAGRLFLDFLLSRAGQACLVAQSMPSVRADLSPPVGLNAPDAPLRAIRVGPALLVDSDRLTRDYVLRRWRVALGPKGG